jgi:hypothetical protein
MQADVSSAIKGMDVFLMREKYASTPPLASGVILSG